MKIVTKRILSLLIAAMALCVTACDGEKTEEEVEQTPVTISLTLSVDKVAFTAEGGIQDVAVISSVNTWDFINAATWLEVEMTDDSLTLIASENKSTQARKGEVVVYATEGTSRAEKIISVEQAASGGTTSDGSLTFECPVFEQMMLESYDRDGDGIISAAEAADVTDMVLTLDETSTNDPITSLKGIKNFVNLVNLDCDGNLLTSLDLSGMEKLEYVDCCYNKIKELNLNGCKSLKWVYCFVNNIDTVHLEGCDNIMFFQAYKNNLTSLNISNRPELIYLDVRLNSLRDIDFTNCPKLNVAAVGSNSLISLNLEGLPELYTLGCYENSIASLDTSSLPNLEMLECYANNISKLDLTANTKLSALTCQRNLISELTIGGTALKKLDCSSNRLAGVLDMTAYSQLYYLHCGGNELKEVKVTTNTKLEDLSCENTLVEALDVTFLVNLESLVANDCLIKSLNCSKNLKLQKLYLQGNPLTSLVLAKGQTISDLKVDNPEVIIYQ